MTTNKAIAATSARDTGEGYADFETLIRATIGNHDGPLFTTKVSEGALWDAYLSHLPADRRQHFNCHECRRFIQRYGNLVTIDEEGHVESLLWSERGVPEFFRESVRTLKELVVRAGIQGVFFSTESIWGTPRTPDKKGREWSHLSGPFAHPHGNKLLHGAPLTTASQAMAEKREEHSMLLRAIADYKRPVVEEAVRVLKADALTGAEKARALGEWFLKLYGALDTQVWRAVALAPVGFCHIRNTVIATLLDDVAAGLSFEEIARRWAEKMHPLQYKRPTAVPTPGAIDAAEKLVEKLGVAKSLERRFATLDDVITKLWTPKARHERSKAGGVFGHLRESEVKTIELPRARVTWEKFARTVLGEAHEIEVMLPSTGNYYGLATAADPEAPPILQWDSGERRNPCSAYVYVSGSPKSKWGLSGPWGKVSAVFRSPHEWLEPEKFKHHGRGIYFAIVGAHDSSCDELALFPDFLKAEFHGIRKTIEAHSKKGRIQGTGSANGLRFDGHNEIAVRVDGSATYVIDRWD